MLWLTLLERVMFAILATRDGFAALVQRRFARAAEQHTTGLGALAALAGAVRWRSNSRVELVAESRQKCMSAGMSAVMVRADAL